MAKNILWSFCKDVFVKKIGDVTPIKEGVDNLKEHSQNVLFGESLSVFLVGSGYAFAYRKYSKNLLKKRSCQKKNIVGQ